MRNSVSIEGKSLIFNIIAIVINLVGFFIILKEFLSDESSTALNATGYILFAIGLAALVFFKGTFLMSYVARAFVGGLFIVSGLIKANDPLGFSYKLEEYFNENALDWPMFEPYALEIAIIICIAEVVLGFAVILGGKIKLASFALLAMTGFFLWLTYFTASCNDAQMVAMEAGNEFDKMCVTDCGCFGDALKGSVGRSLTPWESFTKDAALLYLVLFIFIHQWHIKLNSRSENLFLGAGSILVVGFFCWVFGWLFPLFFALVGLIGALSIHKILPFIKQKSRPWWMALWVTIMTVIFTTYTVSYLPLKDYRPYHVGADLFEKMSDGKPGVYEQVFIYENTKTGETKKFNNEEFNESKIWENKDWEFKDRIQKEIVADIPTSIVDFVPKIEYNKMPEDLKENPIVDSIYQAKFDEYYQEFIALKNTKQGYADTILSMDYDPELYPDTSWTKSEPFVQLIDPENKLKIDLKDYILYSDKIILFVMKKVEEANTSNLDEIKTLINKVKESDQDIEILVLTSSAQNEVSEFESKYELGVPYATMDDIEIKIIVRSNPGMLYLEHEAEMGEVKNEETGEMEEKLIHKSIIKAKYPHRSIPDWDYFKRKLLN